MGKGKLSRAASARQALARRWAGREGHWREVITRQQASGESVAGYCAAAGIGPASFYTWRRRLGLGAKGAAAVTPEPGFLEIRMSRPPRCAAITTLPPLTHGEAVQNYECNCSLPNRRYLYTEGHAEPRWC